MIGWLASLFGGPIISMIFAKIVDAYKLKLDAANTRDALAVDLAKTEIAGEIAARNAAAAIIIAEQGRWWTAMIRPAFAYPLIVYFVVVISACIFGTPMPAALPAPVGDWSGWIVLSYFMGRSMEKVARIFKK